jgi:hypothetical protein
VDNSHVGYPGFLRARNLGDNRCGCYTVNLVLAKSLDNSHNSRDSKRRQTNDDDSLLHSCSPSSPRLDDDEKEPRNNKQWPSGINGDDLRYYALREVNQRIRTIVLIRGFAVVKFTVPPSFSLSLPPVCNDDDDDEREGNGSEGV